MKKKRFNALDESRSMTSLIFLLAWPVFLEQILTTLVSYADTAMVGQLGKNATASVTISNSPIFLLNGVIMSLGVGITAMVAQATGAGDHDLVKKLIRHALLAIVFLGVPICIVIIALHRQIPQWMGADPEILDTAAQYNLIVSIGRIFGITSMILNSVFRGYGDTKTPLVVNATMNVVNVVGNYFLINPTRVVTIFGLEMVMPGAGWGVAGAAVATSLGMFTSGTITVLIAFLRKNGLNVSLKDSFRLDKDVTKKILKISWPAMLERICMSSSGVFCTRAIATLGTASLAANSLCLTAESFSFMPAIAFQTASTTLVGQCLGANRADRAEGFVRRCIIIGIAFMCVTGALCYFFGRQLVGFFTPDEEVIDIGERCMRVIALMQPPQVVCWVLAGALRGAGDTKVSFYITAATQWGIRTLFSILLVLVFHLGLYEVQFAILAEEIVRLVLLVLRYKGGKWKTMVLVRPGSAGPRPALAAENGEIPAEEENTAEK